MDRRRFILIVLCILILVVPLMVPLALCFSNASTGPLLNLADYKFANSGLTLHSSSVYAKDTIFFSSYPNLNTSSPLVVELSGVPQVDSVNFSLSGITAPNSTIGIAESPGSTVSLWNSTYAMSFNIDNQPCYLYNVSLYLIAVKNMGSPSTKTLFMYFSIYNATWNSTTSSIEPGTNITTWLTYDFTSQANNTWKTIDITSGVHGFGGVVPLYPNNTDNGTFFVVAAQNTSLSSQFLNWGYTVDTSGNYSAYNVTSVTPLVVTALNDTDFSTRVYLSATNLTGSGLPFPSNISLQVNGNSILGSTGGTGTCNITGGFGSSSILVFNFTSTWFSTVNFSADVFVYGANLYASIIMTTLLEGYMLGSIFQTQGQNNIFLTIGIIGVAAVSGASLYLEEKKRRIPINAMRNMESIIVDHTSTSTMIWSLDFISMEQDVVLVSGFMSAVKSFLAEMKVGGMKRLGTEFGTFIREETKMLTATCIAGELGLNEEFWIRSKLHEFLINVEQQYHKELEGWKGRVTQFSEAFPSILGSLISLDEVQRLQKQKIEKLARNKNNLQKDVNNYGAKLEELKSRYDSGEMDFKKYIIERYKTEAKYDKVQKDYIYAGLFISRAPSLLEKKLTPKDLEKMQNIQNQFLEVRTQIEELQNKELKGTITSQDIELREKLQKELVSLIEKLDKFKE
ncbi:MAG: hypothetical protein WED07_16435 [Candidatus Freyarchaeum deiterrae]